MLPFGLISNKYSQIPQVTANICVLRRLTSELMINDTHYTLMLFCPVHKVEFVNVAKYQLLNLC